MEKDLKTYLDLIKDIIPNDGERKGMDFGCVLHHVRKLNSIGLEKDAEEIIGWITSKHKKPELIGIVGMGGFGKTALAHKIFFDESVKSHLDERILVSVSQSFSEREILTSMLKQLKVDGSAPIDDEMLQIEKSLSNKKYLIVMDDIWHRYKEWWNVISPYLPQGPGNRNIIITTRYKDVAINMGVAPERIHPTRELDAKESWSLFCEVAFSANKSMMRHPDFENIGKAIVEKCKGYPLAIKGMGGILAQKIHSLHLWNEVLKDFDSNLGNSPSVLASLQSSYDDLPAMHKHCLLCFSLYPKDCKISARQLIYLWVGEGFVKGNGQKTALEIARDCLLELVNRCLVEVVEQSYDGRICICKVHDVVRDMITKNAKGEAFFRNVQKPDASIRHLGCTSDKAEMHLENNSKLRAFVLMKECPLSLQQNTGLATAKSLRVLDLSNNTIGGICVEDLLSWIKSQKCLSYLNLRRVHGLKEFPNWIKKHQNLKIMVITECNDLKRLPPSITTLRNLAVLDLEDCPLENLPQGLERLSGLEILSGLKLPSRGKEGARLSELKSLTEPRMLGIIMSQKDEIEENEIDLSKLHKLNVLAIETKDCDREQVLQLDKILPPSSLHELYLKSYYGETTPNWVTPCFLPELLNLYIEHGELTALSTSFWGTTEEAWKIEGLFLKNLPKLRMDWKTTEQKMRHLRHAEVIGCPELCSLPLNLRVHGVWDKSID